jgi:hypothetical protein
MKNILMKYLWIIALIVIALGEDLTAQVDWTVGLDGNLIQANTGHRVRVDEKKNVYIYSRIHGIRDVDPGPIVNNQGQLGEYSNLLQKFDDKGGLIWAVCYLNSYPMDFDIDNKGNLILVGVYSQDTLDLDPSPSGVYNVARSSYGVESFVVKLNENGIFQWARVYRARGQLDLNRFVIDNSGATIMVGSASGTIVIDSTVVNLGSSQYEICCKIDSNGNLVWFNKIEVQPYMYQGNGGTIFDLAIDSKNSIYTVGVFWGTIDFDPSPTDTTSRSVNQIPIGSYLGRVEGDGFIQKLDSSGKFLWVRKIGQKIQISDYNNDRANGVAIDTNDNVYVIGEFRDHICLDDDTTYQLSAVPDVGSWGKSDGFVYKLDENGVVVWGYSFGNERHDKYTAIAMDKVKNELYLAGKFMMEVDFDFSSNAVLLETRTKRVTQTKSEYLPDAFVQRLHVDGCLLGLERFKINQETSNRNPNLYALFVDTESNLYITGDFVDTLYHDSTILRINRQSNFDVFGLKMTLPQKWECNSNTNPNNGSTPNDKGAFIKIYPNPSLGVIFVELPVIHTYHTLSLIGINGLELKSQSIGIGNEFGIDMGAYPAGVYVIKLEGVLETTVYRKIVKL